MKFLEFKRVCAKYYAYNNWDAVAFAKGSGVIPDKYHDFFEDDCECGSENIINFELTREMCCDPNCPIKTGYRLAEMFSRCGIKGLGYESCHNIYQRLLLKDQRHKACGEDGIFFYNTFTEVLLVPWGKYPADIRASAKGQEFYQACLQVRTKRVTFSQLVSMLGLTDMGQGAARIFSCADSFSAWKDEVVQAGGIQTFCNKRGVLSPEVIASVAQSLEAIAVADFACSDCIRREGLIALNVCITGVVTIENERYTKSKYVELCNDLCIDAKGVQLLEIKNSSGAATVPFVLYSNRDSTNKYLVGQSRGNITDEFGEHPVLLSTTEFYYWLKGAVLEWNKNLDSQNSMMNFCQILKELGDKRQTS